MKKSGLRELTFNNSEKCVHNLNHAPIIKKETSFKNEKHKVFSIKSNKIAMHNGDISNCKMETKCEHIFRFKYSI